MNGDTVAASARRRKEFVLVADALPTHVMDHADLVVPTGVFIEKEGTFFARGRLRENDPQDEGRSILDRVRIPPGASGRASGARAT